MGRNGTRPRPAAVDRRGKMEDMNGVFVSQSNSASPLLLSSFNLLNPSRRRRDTPSRHSFFLSFHFFLLLRHSSHCEELLSSFVNTVCISLPVGVTVALHVSFKFFKSFSLNLFFALIIQFNIGQNLPVVLDFVLSFALATYVAAVTY